MTTPTVFCGCGCGLPTKLAAANSARAGTRKGQPQRYVCGHQLRDPALKQRVSLVIQSDRGTLERNAEIIRLVVALGEQKSVVARAFGVTRQRVDQIVNPDKHRARTAAFALRRPPACQSCAAIGPVEAHHTDYSRPLDVEWLCRPCHRVADKESVAA